MPSCVLAFGFGIWELKAYFSAEGRALDSGIGIGSCLAGIGLIIYERYFLKKFKDVSYCELRGARLWRVPGRHAESGVVSRFDP